MTGTRQLGSGRGQDVRALLVEAGRGESPPAGAHSRALKALGVGAGIAGTAGATGLANASVGVAVKAAPISKLVFLSKWMFVGAGVAVAGIATDRVATGIPSDRRPPIVLSDPTERGATRAVRNLATRLLRESDEPRGSGEPRAQALEPIEQPEEPGGAVEPAAEVYAKSGSAAERVGEPAVGARENAKENSKEHPLALETAELDAARRALQADDPYRALAILNAYSARFLAAELAPEAALLRIETHLKLGDRATAQQLAREFLAAHPSSPHRNRLGWVDRPK